MSLRWKLLIPTILTSILLIGGMIYISLLEYDLYQRQAEQRQLVYQAKVQANLQQMAKDTQRIAHFLVEDWRVADGLLTNNRDSLLELIQPFYAGLAFDWVTIYDNQTKVLVRADQPTWHGFTDSLKNEVKLAFHLDEPITTLTLVDDNLLLVSLERLYPDIHGISALVAVGYMIDNTWLQQFTMSQAQVFDLQLAYSTWQLSKLALNSDTKQWHQFPIKLDNIRSNYPLMGEISEYKQQNKSLWWQIGITISLLLTISGIALYVSHRVVRKTVYSLQRAQSEANKAKQIAEVANQAKSAFLASMSHELRTPLNGILGYAQILNLDDTLNEDQREGLDIIQTSGEHLLMLINEVLDLSKIEAGKIELLPDNLHFQHFMKTVTDIFVLRAKQKGVQFIYETTSSLPNQIYADEQRLRQVLINLLGNAVKFTEHGSVTLQVGYDSGYLRFDITDTGQGIAPEDQEKIFSPFQQVGDDLKKTEGTGLGLAITKKIVEMMNGSLSVHSVLGQGSTFTVRLNLPSIQNPEEMLLSQSDTRAIPSGYEIIGDQRDKYRILVVDDTKANRTLLRDFLVLLGFSVQEASDGQQGLTLTQSWKPDLICTDVVMPVLDGLEFTRLIKKQYPNLPIIVLSASAFKTDRARALTAGCSDFLPKPFYFDDLRSLLSKHLSLKWTFAADAQTTLAADQAQIVFDLAQQGETLKIQEYTDELLKQNPQLAAFTYAIQELSNLDEHEAIMELVQPYMD